MSEKKNKSFFWASYADLMTSLFFVMLMLFVVAVVELNKRNGELSKMNESITIENERLSMQLNKAKEIENATTGLESTYFEYLREYKKHKLTIDVSFDTNEWEIKTNCSKETQARLKEAGEAAKSFIDSTTSRYPGIQYLLIIEGQASLDYYQYNYELSYQRALSLKKFWEEKNILFTDKNCEVLICGSGDGRLSGTGLMRETNEKLNQRFLIHILPKPGIIEDVTKN